MFKSFQEAFDTTVLKLEAQGAFSYNVEEEVCMYTDRSGNQCAVGIHFPPHHLNYTEFSKVGSFSNDPLISNIGIENADPRDVVTFWINVQQIHDGLAEKKYVEDYVKVLHIEFLVDTALLERITNLSTPWS